MYDLSRMCGDTTYCPKKKISVDKTACYECEYHGKWSKEPNSMSECWFDYELRQELRQIDENREK